MTSSKHRLGRKYILPIRCGTDDHAGRPGTNTDRRIRLVCKPTSRRRSVAIRRRAEVAIAAEAPGQPGAVVLLHQVLKLAMQRVPEVTAERVSVTGSFGDHPVDDAAGGQVSGADALPCGDFRSVAGVAVDEGAGTFGCQRGEPGMLCGDGAVGGQQGQRRTAGSLPEQN